MSKEDIENQENNQEQKKQPESEAPREDVPKAEEKVEEQPQKEEAPQKEQSEAQETPQEDTQKQPQAEEQAADGESAGQEAAEEAKAEDETETKRPKLQKIPPKEQQNTQPKSQQKQQQKSNQAQAADPEFIEKVISINRVTKVTKGGKKLSFSALVVVGDGKGKVGYSLSKANEVAIAIQKAMKVAKKDMIKVPMQKASITHEIIGECCGAEVLLKPASEGTGVIAAGPVRAVCDSAGIHDILTKCHRSNNPINVVKATIDGLSRLKISKISEEPVEEKPEVEVGA